MSFQLNINEIIGSIDEKSELQKMKEELQNKDRCIQELLRKIEQLDRTVNNFKDGKSRDYTTASSGGQGAPNHGQNRDSSLFQGIQISKVNKSMAKGETGQKSLIQHRLSSHQRQESYQRRSIKINNYLGDKESLSLGGSEKENTSLLKNAIATTSGDEDRSAEEIIAAINQSAGHEKIQNVLEKLNLKMTQFKEERRLIEEEIKRGVHASSASLVSEDDSDNEI